jgi:DMSO/TMAO reductase YedYZ molybdopterin-dependent catalytic subunit
MNTNTPIDETPSAENAPVDETAPAERTPIDLARSPERTPVDLVVCLECANIDESSRPERTAIDELAPSERAPIDETPRFEAGPLEPRLRRLSRRGFAVGGAAALAGLAGWQWLVTRSEEDGLTWPLRRVLGLNERLARAAFRASSMAPEFPRRSAREPRVNGVIGLDPTIAARDWRLRAIGPSGERDARLFQLDEIKSLPRVEMTTELKCIEGWSTVVYWAGARLADLAAQTGLATRSGRGQDPKNLLRYTALETPDREYYVGLDIESALHPQTLLCYEMDGAPLTASHGAPLRLVIPVKYGIKNLKQIGTIRFTDVRPADYWAERGYDWYAGH